VGDYRTVTATLRISKGFIEAVRRAGFSLRPVTPDSALAVFQFEIGGPEERKTTYVEAGPMIDLDRRRIRISRTLFCVCNALSAIREIFPE